MHTLQPRSRFAWQYMRAVWWCWNAHAFYTGSLPFIAGIDLRSFIVHTATDNVTLEFLAPICAPYTRGHFAALFASDRIKHNRNTPQNFHHLGYVHTGLLTYYKAPQDILGIHYCRYEYQQTGTSLVIFQKFSSSEYKFSTESVREGICH